MLAPSDAIDRAHSYLGEVIPDFAALEPRVEEMVLDKDSANWNITFCALSSPEKSQENTLADLLRKNRYSRGTWAREYFWIPTCCSSFWQEKSILVFSDALRELAHIRLQIMNCLSAW